MGAISTHMLKGKEITDLQTTEMFSNSFKLDWYEINHASLFGNANPTDSLYFKILCVVCENKFHRTEIKFNPNKLF